MKETIITTDIVIMGGGIAGLWALNRLRALGYQAILLESNTLGGGQTIKSQGIIHGGIKFALKGILTGSSNAVETMPTRWKNCLSNSGEINLQAVKILSYEQLLWSTGSLTSEIASFFASKSLNSRVQKLSHKQYPSILQNPDFKGHVYRLEEVVLDTPSLIQVLASPYKDFIFKINSAEGYQLVFKPGDPKTIDYLKIHSGTQSLNIHAQRYLLTAGEGNEQLASVLSNPSAMQRRPLHMVIAKLNGSYPLFAHCIDGGMNPRITITTHSTQEGKTVWYLGGQIAEEGIHRTQDEQCTVAKHELHHLFPWLDLTLAKWSSFFVNRAEPAQPGGKRPETDFLQTIGNAILAWPTKLALAPLLTDHIIAQLKKQKIEPSTPSQNECQELSTLEKPMFALPPWETI